MVSLQGFFITGTDTGVGKSEVTAALAAALTVQGKTVYPRKPIESGCLPDHQGEQLFPQDGYQLQQASQSDDSLATITPYRFLDALSPERAAELSGTTITIPQLVEACSAPAKAPSVTLVEGAGGFYSPIAQGALNADLAVALQHPVILVAQARLGVINQVLLARAAIQQQGLSVAAIVLNQHSAEDYEGNLAGIRQRVTEPVITLPEITEPPAWSTLQAYITPLIDALGLQ